MLNLFKKKLLKLYYDTDSFWFKYVSAMMAALLIPTLLGFILSEFSFQSTVKQANIKNFQALENIQKSLDQEFVKSRQLAFDIALNQKVLDIAKMKKNAKMIWELSTLNTIPQFTNISDDVSTVYIYLKNHDMIIGKNSKYSPMQFWESVMSLDDISFEEFCSRLNTTHYNTLYPVSSTHSKTSMSSPPTMMYLQSFPIYESFEGNILICINFDKLTDFFQNNYSNENSCLYLIDEHGKIRLQLGNEKYIDSSFCSFSDGYGKAVINGENITYCVKSSGFDKYKYVSIENDVVAKAGLRPIRVAIYTYLIIVLLFGAVGVFIISFKNTKPIRELSDALSTSLPAYDETDKIKKIEKAVRHLLNEKIRTDRILETGKSALKKAIISDILHGNFFNVDSILSACDRVEINFEYPFFCVFCIELSDTKNDDIAVIKYALTNVLEEIFSPDGAIFIESSGLLSLSALINLPEYTDDSENSIKTNLLFTKNLFADEFDIDINIGISSVCADIENVCVLYSEAKTAKDFCVLTGLTGIMFYRDVSKEKDYYRYPIEIEKKLLSAVINGDIAEVKSIIDYIICSNSQLSLEMNRCLFFDLTATAIKIISSSALDLSLIFEDEFEPVESLMQCKSINELTNCIYNIFEKICDYVNNDKSTKKEKLKDEITTYLEQNCANPNMSLKMLADAFGFTYTYMSHFFTDNMSDNFVKYVTGLRIQKASEMLRLTDRSIAEIAEQVGYSSNTVLIKIFKKEMNMTPGAYRELHKSN